MTHQLSSPKETIMKKTVVALLTLLGLAVAVKTVTHYIEN